MGSSMLHSPAYQAFLPSLKKWREELGVTQVMLASKLGKKQSYIQKTEAGERRIDENANLRLEIRQMWKSRVMKTRWLGRAFKRKEGRLIGAI